ncbi:hypothetical protein HK102_004770 [Quaeritorhiza haematococci]|nr:hypothetical protein HK102_004770 [Quaeritorhiza haematococci]
METSDPNTQRLQLHHQQTLQQGQIHQQQQETAPHVTPETPADSSHPNTTANAPNDSNPNPDSLSSSIPANTSHPQALPLSLEDLIDIDTSYSFDFEEFIKTELNLCLDRDKTANVEICKFFLKGFCAKGNSCPFKHSSRNEKTVVCKHWLRGLCKKGDLCEFLHEYNLKKMPECWFYTKYGECSNPECMYLHVDPASKIKECACPKYELPNLNQNFFDQQNEQGEQIGGEGVQRRFRPLEEVTCFKCGEKGHFANHCPRRMGAAQANNHFVGRPIPTVS